MGRQALQNAGLSGVGTQVSRVSVWSYTACLLQTQGRILLFFFWTEFSSAGTQIPALVKEITHNHNDVAQFCRSNKLQKRQLFLVCRSSCRCGLIFCCRKFGGQSNGSFFKLAESVFNGLSGKIYLRNEVFKVMLHLRIWAGFFSVNWASMVNSKLPPICVVYDILLQGKEGITSVALNLYRHSTSLHYLFCNFSQIPI